jgi:hypothetical protein
LRVPENRKFRRIFGPKRKDVAGDWRQLLMWSFIDGCLLGCSAV